MGFIPRGTGGARVARALGAVPAGYREGTGADYGRFFLTLADGKEYAVVGDQGGQLYLEDAQGNNPVDAKGNIITVSDVALNNFINSAEFADIRTAELFAEELASASPQMRAILTDPEWQGYQHTGIPPFDQISDELQAKIALVPLLYEQLTNSPDYLADVAKSQASQAAAAAAAQGPARYLAMGISFDASGNVLGVQGRTDVKTGDVLTADELAALLAGQDLPSSSSSPAGNAPPATSPALATPPKPTVDPASVPDAVVVKAIAAVTNAGGNPMAPTSIIDIGSGQAVATVQQLANGSIQVGPPSKSVTNTVSGIFDWINGTISNIGTEVKKIENAATGAVAGAQAGYNAPTDWKPLVIGVGAVVGLGALLYAIAD